MTLFAEQMPWWAAGPVCGGLLVGLLAVANKPFGALGGYVDLADRAARVTSTMGWRAFFAVGVVLGGFLWATAAGAMHLSFATGSLDAQVGAAKPFVLAGAGMLMGYGARTAGGCTSGHGLCGTAQGSPASFAATGTFMASAIATTLLLTQVLG